MENDYKMKNHLIVLKNVFTYFRCKFYIPFAWSIIIPSRIVLGDEVIKKYYLKYVKRKGMCYAVYPVVVKYWMCH
jgi:hypothetical protein